MNDTGLQLALREWRTHMAAPVRMAIFAGIVVILTMTGPFETLEVMRAVPRLAYWGVVVVTCYSVGYFVNQLAAARTRGKGVVLRILIAAPLTALGVLMVIYMLNGLAIGYWATGPSLIIIAGNVLVISSIITIIFHIAEPSGDIVHQPPSLLDRVAFDKRGPFVAISVEDHYVRIRTIKGEDMVLMRLADAIREVGDTPGIQVHRSHWIATARVTAATRKGDGAVLTMAVGDDIPVSRANIPKIKEAGLLPRT